MIALVSLVLHCGGSCADVNSGSVEVVEKVKVEEEVVAAVDAVTGVVDDVISSNPTVRNRSQMYPLA